MPLDGRIDCFGLLSRLASISGAETGVGAAWVIRTESRRNAVRVVALTLSAASLAACAQPSSDAQRSTFYAPTRQAAVEHRQNFRFASTAHESVVRRHEASSSDGGAATHVASQGMA